MLRRILLILMILVLNISGICSAKDPSEVHEKIQHFAKGALPSEVTHKILKVAVCEMAPFAFLKNGGESYQGISIDVWEFIARKNGISFKYFPVTKEEGIKGISERKYDILLGGIPDFVQEKGHEFEYTVPFYVSGLGVAALKSDPIKVVMDYFISWNFFKVILILLIFIIVQTFTLWIFERKINPHYKGGFWTGIGNGLWWSAGIAALNEAGDVSTKSMWGRVIAVFWMFVALILVNIFTGSIASKLTVGELSAHIQELSALRHLKVVCLDGTESKRFLDEHFISCKVVPSLKEGLSSLNHNDAQALVYNEPALKYEMNNHPNPNIKFIPAGIVNQYYSFMVPRGSDILYFLNQEILMLLNMQEVRSILLKYFGSGQDMRSE
ncbi:MAG TPA: transporter substrate-binding domain-containing protein [Alphaproteobacteria bacterium]|nr:transporter substrate-binding domain-containing protein [Alphaproteobacteria bacterium]HQS94158.1 transporter substrate-binding domain-containing protein [Alphaproteobacteria bacterium]